MRRRRHLKAQAAEGRRIWATPTPFWNASPRRPWSSSWGAGPRAVQYLILGAKSRAALQGSYMVRLEDVVAVAEPVLMHRVITSFAAESEGTGSKEIVRRLVSDLEREG